MLGQPWIYGISSKKQARYKPVTNCTYCIVLGSYNNWNIIHLSQKSTHFEAFDETHQVVIDEISYNMVSFIQLGIYGSINTSDTTKNVYYIINFISESYMLKTIQQLMENLLLRVN